MLSESKWKQYGVQGSKIKGIVIHNTNNQYMNAKQLENWLENECETSSGCHYLVDNKSIIQVMPDDWSVFNVGNGMQFGNLDCIAIEICSNPNNQIYLEGEQKAIKLIKKLMKKYHLTKDDIFFHRDFQPNINCPAQIIKRYKNKKAFIRLLERK